MLWPNPVACVEDFTVILIKSRRSHDRWMGMFDGDKKWNIG